MHTHEGEHNLFIGEPTRKKARAALRLLPGVDVLFRCERKVMHGEADEPEIHP